MLLPVAPAVKRHGGGIPPVAQGRSMFQDGQGCSTDVLGLTANLLTQRETSNGPALWPTARLGKLEWHREDLGHGYRGRAPHLRLPRWCGGTAAWVPRRQKHTGRTLGWHVRLELPMM